MVKKSVPTPARTYNARRDTFDFRYVTSLTEVLSEISLDDYLIHSVTARDQAEEGACTGFGLATFVNCLLIKRSRFSAPKPVLSLLLYEFSRCYDEWPGEDYSGSTARGAMKGWNKHGVCIETDWSYDEQRSDARTSSLACKRPYTMNKLAA